MTPLPPFTNERGKIDTLGTILIAATSAAWILLAASFVWIAICGC